MPTRSPLGLHVTTRFPGDDYRDTLAAWSPAVGVADLPGQGDDGGQDDGGGEGEAPVSWWWRALLWLSYKMEAAAAVIRRLAQTP